MRIVLCKEAVDGGLEVNDRMKNAALEATLRQFGEEALDGLEPRARGRCEVEGEALVAVEPGAHLGMLGGGIVVEDDVDSLVGRHLGVDGVEKTDELLMPVTLHVPADNGAVEHVEGGKQRRRAVPLAVVRHSAEPAPFQGQAGLGAVERLDLALLIYRQHDGVGRWVDVEADDVLELSGELRVVSLQRGLLAIRASDMPSGCRARSPRRSGWRGQRPRRLRRLIIIEPE